MSDDAIADLLLDDNFSRHVISSDVDDVNLYGSKYRRRIAGTAGERLMQNGLEPVVYQAINWWCLVFVPLVPLGAYAVADYKVLLDDGSDQSRTFRVQMDWSQAFLHATIGLMAVFLIGLVIWFAFARGAATGSRHVRTIGCNGAGLAIALLVDSQLSRPAEP